MLAWLLRTVLRGEILAGRTIEELYGALSRRAGVAPSLIARLIKGTGGTPAIVRVVSFDRGHRIEVDPSLTWAALAGYPETQATCERFLGLRA